MCGENRMRLSCWHGTRGSPPRVRGKPPSLCAMPPFYRITPACAGKTPLKRLHPSQAEDHPRVCGENRGTRHWGCPVKGSPPRVRGKRHLLNIPRHFYRITPACAGKTFVAPFHSRTAEDHPRVCGENALDARACPQCVGSPPRVRGKRPAIEDYRFSHGITPACAGKTS